jgi:hypothetical protein
MSTDAAVLDAVAAAVPAIAESGEGPSPNAAATAAFIAGFKLDAEKMRALHKSSHKSCCAALPPRGPRGPRRSVTIVLCCRAAVLPSRRAAAPPPCRRATVPPRRRCAVAPPATASLPHCRATVMPCRRRAAAAALSPRHAVLPAPKTHNPNRAAAVRGLLRVS